MGAYLNKPVTEKETESGGNGRIKYAATSMQGWRVNQEDAHNCLVDLLEGWALFAVYDGHGGPEVAKYTADKFPDFLMKREFWKNDDVVKALQDVFVDFDDHLRSDAAIKQLKVIAGHIKEKKTDETDAEKADMYDEASLPLHELLAKYGVRLVQNGVSGGIAGTLLNNGDESGDDEDEEEEDEESGEADDKADAKPEKSASEEIKQPAEKEDEQKKCVTKRACESPVQDDAKRPKTEAPEDVKESRTESVTTGEAAKQEQNGPATIQENGKHDEDVSNGGDGSDATPIVPKMREKTVHEPKPKEKVEAIQPSAEGDSSDDDDYVVEDEESGDGESDDDEDEELELDEEDEFVATGEVPGEDSGTTACVCLMNDKQILVANIGDSRAVLCRGGKAFDLSFDHKPEDEVENTRIRKAGGRVTEDGRVNGGLNLSRAFGDHCYKKNSGLPLAEQMISAFPDVKTEDFTEDDTFLIVACDGIWNSMDSQQAITFVKERMEKGLELEKIVEEICTACLAENTAGDGTGCDNMTVILVDLVAKKSAST